MTTLITTTTDTGTVRFAPVPLPQHYSPTRTFDARVDDRTLRVGFVGLGYTGLPLAVGFARAGLPVVGVDVDPVKIAAVNAGESYLPDITDLELQDVGQRLLAIGDPIALDGSDAIVICVPTPVTEQGGPDLTYVDGAVESLLPHVRRGLLLVLQSTVPAGTTAAIGRRISERTGLRPGHDFHLAMVPERVDPANKAGWTLTNTPKLVGGLTPECTRRAQRLFDLVCRTIVPVSAPGVAELAKVFENTFRLVNIALVNELADLCRSLSLPAREVIDAAATKPFAFLAHYPGPGVGGECIPVDPLFLAHRAEQEGIGLDVVRAAHRNIAQRPVQVVDRLESLLAHRPEGLAAARILLVGVSYKPDVPDLRNAPALDIVRELRTRGADISYHDPLVADLDVDGQAVTALPWTDEVIAAQDCVVLVTPHQRITADPGWARARLVLDTRNELTPASHIEVL